VYQAGTLSGNPLCVAAGLATLRTLQEENPYERLTAQVDRVTGEMKRIAEAKGIPVALPKDGSMFSVFFRESEPQNFPEVKEADGERFAKVFHAMLDAGIYLPPSPFETSFVSICHDDSALDQTLEAWEKALRGL
jgi:glutamate-1-semialdehyde 2,1-aminomutase